MSQASKLLSGFLLALALVTALHGWLNLGWLAPRARARLSVGHLPVT